MGEKVISINRKDFKKRFNCSYNITSILLDRFGKRFDAELTVLPKGRKGGTLNFKLTEKDLFQMIDFARNKYIMSNRKSSKDIWQRIMLDLTEYKKEVFNENSKI